MRIRSCIVAGMMGLGSVNVSSTTYTVEVLPAFGNPAPLVTDFNDSGWLAGYRQDGGYSKGVLWNTQQWQQLPGFSMKNTFANGVNNEGVTVGQSDLPTMLAHGFSFQQGTLTDITPANKMGSAYGINDAGTICGYAYFNGIGTRAFIRQQGVLQPLGTLGGSSSMGFAINGANQVVGRSVTAARVQTAFFATGTTMVSIAPQGATWSTAEAVNDLGWAVGYYRGAQGGYRGFIYNGVQSIDAGLISGTQELQLMDINNSNTAVGFSIIDTMHGVAVKYENGALVDLSTEIDPASTVQLGAALAINNKGWIAVLASVDGGATGVLVILKPQAGD